jgi:hypothetical protein
MSDQTTTSAERREGLLRRVRGLIDTADSFEELGNSEAAQTYRNKADEMMTVYAVEEFELAFATGTERAKPELREYVYGDAPEEVADHLSTLFYALAEHCRVKIGYYGWVKSKIVGYPQDLEYLDVLFTSVRMHMSSQVRPHASRTLGYEESLAVLKESGQKWADIYPALLRVFPERFDRARADHKSNAKLLPGYSFWQEAQEFVPTEEDFEKNHKWIKVDEYWYLKEMVRPIGVRFTKEYTEFCKNTDRHRIYSDPKTYLRSFVRGYVSEVQRRIWAMEQATSEATTGMELVLANIMDDLLEFYYENFPERRPHPKGCDCDDCHRCNDPKCNRPRCKAARVPVKTYRVREQAYSVEGAQRGRQAGANADLTGRGRGVGGSKPRELD